LLAAISANLMAVFFCLLEFRYWSRNCIPLAASHPLIAGEMPRAR
jgi:hypothetical protein